MAPEENVQVGKHWGVYAGRVVICILLIIQAGALDYLLIYHNEVSHYGWIAVDVIVMVGFLVTFLIHRWAKNQRECACTCFLNFARYPLGFIAWFIYSAFLVAKVVAIYESDIPQKLEHHHPFSPTTLKIAIGATSVVFMFECLIQHHPLQTIERKTYIDILAYVISVDILDCVDQLDAITEDEHRGNISKPMYDTILAIVCVNFMITFLPMLILSRMRHDGETIHSYRVKSTYALMHILVVNVTFLIIRLILWNSEDIPISVFIIKNFIILIIDSREFYNGCVSTISLRKRSTDGDSMPEKTEMKLINGNEEASAEKNMLDDIQPV